MRKHTAKEKTKQCGYRIRISLAEKFAKFCDERGWAQNRQLEIAMAEWMDSHATRKSVRR